jgi:hypothetical protein
LLGHRRYGGAGSVAFHLESICGLLGVTSTVAMLGLIVGLAILGAAALIVHVSTL